jgi:hypothetical protein
MGDASFLPSISVHIVLPEDTAAKSTAQPVVRRGGDVISGHVEVLTRGGFRFEISLVLEG